MRSMLDHLERRTTNGAAVQLVDSGGWRLAIPAGGRDRYRLAQLDDYSGLARRRFPWQSPVRMRLAARVSAAEVPGTWGMGFWNDPFGLSLGMGGDARRLPTLPNAAWFFFASPPNHLSFRDDLPGNGALAATFRGGAFAGLAMVPGLVLAPLLALPPTARLLRRGLSRLILQDSAALAQPEAEAWHEYEIYWSNEHVSFSVDGERVLETQTVPAGPLGLVLWIDNQFAAFTPAGKIGYGMLASPEPVWIELDRLSVTHG